MRAVMHDAKIEHAAHGTRVVLTRRLASWELRSDLIAGQTPIVSLGAGSALMPGGVGRIVSAATTAPTTTTAAATA